MAVPKNKMSRSRTRHRRAQWLNRTKMPNLTYDPETNTWRRAHTVNPETVQYKKA